MLVSEKAIMLSYESKRNSEPRQGPSLHRHPYREVLILLEGNGQPHAFVGSGDGQLRQIGIHASEWNSPLYQEGDHEQGRLAHNHVG
jgi:hypothetical protein